MKKTIFSIFIALALWAGLSTAASAADYSDVPDGHWAAGSIQEATSLGIFQGLDDGRFGLGRPISRAEFVTALVRFFGWESPAGSRASYADVPGDVWFAAAVETALANNALAAAGQEFHPYDVVTRSEMASMILRSLGYTYLAGSAAEYSVPFSDVSVNRGFITLAYDLGLMTGAGQGLFDPEAPATREQAATVLVRVHDQLAAPSVPLDSLAGYRALSVDTPAARADDELPITPLEPLTGLYAALRRMKGDGGDPASTALRLTAGGVETLSGPGGLTTTALSPREVQEALAHPNAKTYYSDQYESAYCIYQPNPLQTATLWYQSEESMAAKLQLAKLFGVTHYLLE